MTLRGAGGAVVTGATAGLGLETARGLAATGMDVTLAVRDVGKGERVAERIRAGRTGGRLAVVHLDLADLDSVHAAAATIADSGPVDVLVNNAGVAAQGRRQETRQGLELQMGVNHLGHFALTALLMPRLRQAPRPRVVSVTSLAARSAGRLDPRLGDAPDVRGFHAYAQSKLACGLFGLELDRRVREAGLPLVSVVAHPGWSATHLFGRNPAAVAATRLLASNPAHGARSQLRAALDPSLRGGELIGPRFGIGGAPRQRAVAENMADPNSASILWELSEEHTGVRFDVG